MRGPASKESERIEQIVAAMKLHGPLALPRLVELTGWSRQSLSTQLRKSADRFERISDHVFAIGGSIPATFYLKGEQSDISEEELERRADQQSRSFEGWPEADNVVISAINAMIKSGAQAWHR
jgi:lambda repressor-like predicted transcriptional regulator